MNLEEYKNVWVYIEADESKIASVSLELLGEGRKLADKSDSKLAGVMIGHQVTAHAQQLIEQGADLVYVYDAPIFKDYLTETYNTALLDAVTKHKPNILLFGSTSQGKDIASAVATDIPTGLTADTTILDIEENILHASRPAFGGNIMATILCKKNRPQMATVRPKVMKPLAADASRTGEVISESVEIDESKLKTKLLEVVINETVKFKIDEADIVVCAGKGVGTEEGFAMVNALADAMGATVGGTRDVVEAGFLEHHMQIGQTGVTVMPKIYFAIGLSGAIQHVVGMQNADLIIAINKDPNAAIFDVAHYGIVGDAFEIVPKITEEVKKGEFLKGLVTQ